MTAYETVKLALQDAIATQRSGVEEEYNLKALEALELLK